MNKKEKEKVKKDISLAFDFARYLIDHPEELDKIPAGAEITFNEKSEAIVPAKKKSRKKNILVDVKRDFSIKKKVA